MADTNGIYGDDPPQLQARDILSPSATLLGFIITALGIVISLASDQTDFLRNVFFILLGAVIFLVLSAILTVISSIRRSRSAWWWARIIYVASWIFLGLIIIIILVGMVFGVKALQIQLPDFDENIISIIAIASTVISLVLSVLKISKYESELQDSVIKLNTSIEKNKRLIENTIQNVTSRQEPDKEMSFIRIFIDIEKKLREIITLYPDYGKYDVLSVRRMVQALSLREVIDKNVETAFLVINKIRNNVVHGSTVTQRELDMALNLSASLLIDLVRIHQKLSQQ